jgi:hypothetical protein
VTQIDTQAQLEGGEMGGTDHGTRQDEQQYIVKSMKN